MVAIAYANPNREAASPEIFGSVRACLLMTGTEFVRVLAALDVTGVDAVVHADPGSCGSIEGGDKAFCELILQCVGSEGTVLWPAFTRAQTVPELTTAPVPFHTGLPVDPQLGSAADVFRTLPGVIRSVHPSHSFCAWGRHAGKVLSTHRDNNPLGPIKKLHVMRGYALLLGTSLRQAMAIHLAEEMSTMAYLRRAVALRINTAGFDERVVIDHFPRCSRAFDRLEAALDPEEVLSAPWPGGVARKIPLRYLIRLVGNALIENPRLLICDTPDCTGCAARREALEENPAHSG